MNLSCCFFYNTDNKEEILYEKEIPRLVADDTPVVVKRHFGKLYLHHYGLKGNIINRLK